jgi:hypothetical protein
MVPEETVAASDLEFSFLWVLGASSSVFLMINFGIFNWRCGSAPILTHIHCRLSRQKTTNMLLSVHD